MLDGGFQHDGGGRALSKRKTQTQWPTDAPAPDDLAGVNGDDVPSPPEEAAAEPAPPSLPAGPPVWRDIPVASVLPPVAPLLPSPAAPIPLEDRLHRLEAELARLRSGPPADAPASARSIVRHPGGFWDGVGKRLLAPSGPPAPPPPRPDDLASVVPPGVRRTWRLLDALTELRAMYWMYFDPRYRLSWFGRLGPLVILALILTSGFWMPATGLPVLGLVIEKLGDLVLAYLLFKLLSHEARRYRETAPDLPPSLRL